MINAPTEKTKRIPELDGLRGVAILLVVSFHYINNQLVNSPGTIAKILCKLTSFGWVGVDLFFVLSGYLIGIILINKKRSANYFSTFYFRRIVRIIPNYFLLIFIFLLLLNIPYFSDSYFLTGNNVLPVWSYFAMTHNFYMAKLANLGNSAMSVTWSIGIEEQFYIVFPFIVYFLKDKWLLIVLILAIILTPVFRSMYANWIPPYVLLNCRMDAISFGALIAYFSYHFDLSGWVSRHINWLLLIMLLDILVCAVLFYKFQDIGVIRNTLFGIFFSGCLILALTKKNNLYAAFLRNKLLGFVGTISYSLYLFHYMILGLFHYFLFGKDIGIYNGKDILITIAAFITSILFSWVIYMRLETPMVSIGKRLQY